MTVDNLKFLLAEVLEALQANRTFFNVDRMRALQRVLPVVEAALVQLLLPEQYGPYLRLVKKFLEIEGRLEAGLDREITEAVTHLLHAPVELNLLARVL